MNRFSLDSNDITLSLAYANSHQHQQSPPPPYQTVTHAEEAAHETTTPTTDQINNNTSTNILTTNNSMTKEASREAIYREIITKHEINNDFANRLQQLQGFKVVFIFDDSGSMNTVLQVLFYL